MGGEPEGRPFGDKGFFACAILSALSLPRSMSWWPDLDTVRV